MGQQLHWSHQLPVSTCMTPERTCFSLHQLQLIFLHTPRINETVRNLHVCGGPNDSDSCPQRRWFCWCSSRSAHQNVCFQVRPTRIRTLRSRPSSPICTVTSRTRRRSLKSSESASATTRAFPVTDDCSNQRPAPMLLRSRLTLVRQLTFLSPFSAFVENGKNHFVVTMQEKTFQNWESPNCSFRKKSYFSQILSWLFANTNLQSVSSGIFQWCATIMQFHNSAKHCIFTDLGSPGPTVGHTLVVGEVAPAATASETNTQKVMEDFASKKYSSFRPYLSNANGGGRLAPDTSSKYDGFSWERGQSLNHPECNDFARQAQEL